MYGTGYSLPGPPSSLALLSSSPSSLHISWGQPQSTNGPLVEYQVSVSPAGASPGSSPLLLRFSPPALTARLTDLLPGRQYRVEVSAVSSQGEGPPTSLLLWTKLGPPSTPPPPLVLPSPFPTPGRLTVRLRGVEEPAQEHVTSYLVLVLGQGLHLQEVQEQQLVGWRKAQEEGSDIWVTAKLRPEQLSQPFTVGDGRLVGGEWNHELPEGRGWRVELVAVAELNGETRRSYSGAGQEVVKQEEEQEASATPSPLVLGLTVTTVLATLVLISAIGVFVYLRHGLGAR